MDRDALEERVERVAVFARVSPEHKLHIVEALQDRGHIVAMTGDGVNDAPALKKADIGVAMGITGTEVAKEASEMVLLDDNFATIVAAVEEGRVIYDNIRKFIKYTMTSNTGELLVMLLAPFVGMPLPLRPLQILWINLVTDGLPGLALTVEPGEKDVMKRPPYSPQARIFNGPMVRDMGFIGLLMGLVSLGVGLWYYAFGGARGQEIWQTMVFTTLTLSQMGNALAVRSSKESLFTLGLRSNVFLLGAVLLTFVLQLAVIYLPALQSIFNTVALKPSELLLALVLSTVVFWGVELEKVFVRRGLFWASRWAAFRPTEGRPTPETAPAVTLWVTPTTPPRTPTRTPVLEVTSAPGPLHPGDAVSPEARQNLEVLQSARLPVHDPIAFTEVVLGRPVQWATPTPGPPRRVGERETFYA